MRKKPYVSINKNSLNSIGKKEKKPEVLTNEKPPNLVGTK